MKWFLFVFALVLIFAVSVMRNHKRDCRTTKIVLPNGTQKIEAELAITQTEQTKGLSERSTLAPDHGMLFVFPSSAIYTFWMKNTLIPLDIIWLENKKIVEITTLQSEIGSTIPTHTPSHKADTVLEINANLAKSLNLNVGSQLDWNLPCKTE